MRTGFQPPAGQLGVYVEQAISTKGQATHLVHSASGPLAHEYYRNAARLFREAAEFCEKAAKEVGRWCEPQDFEHAGFQCAVRQGHCPCGYVGVPKGHPWQTCEDYNSPPLADLDVHGGVTFAEWGDGGRLAEGFFWVGFDTAHMNSAGVDVLAETKRLAEMAREAASGGSV